MSTSLRVSHWPGRLPIEPPAPFLLNKRKTHVNPRGEEYDRGETYLALVNIDLDKREEIVAFSRAHLPLLPRLWWTRLVPDDKLKGTYTGAVVARAIKHANDYGSPFEEEFRFTALVIRDMVTAWRVILENLDPETQEWEACPNRARRMNDEGGAATLLEVMLNAGLQHFHPRIHIGSEDGEDRSAPPFAGGFVSCCLELYNHILEKAQYLTCENDRCRNVFVRKKGGAVKGRYHLSGVKYCSRLCAGATASREYFRRQKDGTQTDSEAEEQHLYPLPPLRGRE
jgi:hypothetical protein